jgi:hypothetical protein
MGDRDKALTYLEKALAEGNTDLIFINVEPYFAPLRNDPRFQAVVRAAGLKGST